MHGNWLEGFDTKHRRYYYANMETKQVSWEFPKELLSNKTIVNRAKYWIESFDTLTNQPYYFNRWTRETRWIIPADTSPAPMTRSLNVVSSSPNVASRNNAFAALRTLEEEADCSPIDEMELSKEIEFGDRFSIGIYTAFQDPTTVDLMAACAGKSMLQYAQMKYLVDRKGIFSTRTSIEKLLSWKSDLIKHPLTIINGDLAKDAVQVFRNITAYMGDRSTSKKTVDHALKIILLGLSSPQIIRDEIFCQICKQTTDNPQDESAAKGWTLMLVCLTSFSPSVNLELYFMSHCVYSMKVYEMRNPTISKLAESTLHKIRNSMACMPRCELPTVMEMEAIRRGVPIRIRIYLVDGTYILMNADSWLSVQECEENISVVLGLNNSLPFGLFEVSGNGDERKLNAKERVLDILAVWQHIELESIANNEPITESEEFYFLYKVRYFIDVNPADKNAVELMYRQAVHDVINATYLCRAEDSFILGAIQLQEEFGDYSDSLGELKNKLTLYLPERDVIGEGTSTLPLLLSRYTKLTGYTKEECKLSYIDYVHLFPMYGATYFFANITSMTLPKDVVIAVNGKGLRLLDNNSKEYLEEYEYDKIVTWGHTSEALVLQVMGVGTHVVKMMFQTAESSEICAMMHVYVANQQQTKSMNE